MTGVGGVSKPPTPTLGVPIMLDKERHLRYTMKTVRQMREEFGEKALEEGVGVDGIAKLIWHGLKHEDPALTVEQVEDMVDLEHLADITNAVVLATGNRAVGAALNPRQPAPPADAGESKSQSGTEESTPTDAT